jgi:DNA-binding GntR family transcriptional regulator
MAIEKLKRAPSLYETVLAAIRKAIVEGSIELGEHLSEAKVSARFGVSKTPVREAMQELRREGLVQIDPQSGTKVFMPSEDELAQIFDMRILLETGAAQRLFNGNRDKTAKVMLTIVSKMEESVKREDYAGYRQLDSEFHKCIISGAQNKLIEKAYEPLSTKIDALRSRGLKSTHVVFKSLAFHAQLLKLLQANDKAGFIEGLETHIKNSHQDYRNWFNDTSKSA